MVRETHPPLEDLAEADLARVRHALVEGGEGAAVVEVGNVHDMSGSTKFVGERVHAGCATLRVVEEQHLRHLTLPSAVAAATPP
jgi:hypothetical protein